MKRRWSSIGRFLKSKSKNNNFCFCIRKKRWPKIVNNLFINSWACGGGYGSYHSSIWHPSIHTVISFIFRRCSGGDMLVINASNHTGNPEGNSDYWVTSRGHRKMLSSERHFQIRLGSFKPIYTPLTYSPVIHLFDGFVPRKKSQNDKNTQSRLPW